MLQTIGKLVWGSAGWAMPALGLTPYLLAAATVAFGLATGFAYFKGAEGKAAAIATEQAACEIRMSEISAKSARSMSELLSSIRAGEDAATEPKTSAEEKELCRKSKLCRSSRP